MGKTLGKDADSGKLTCVSAYGIEGTRKLIARYQGQAHEALARYGERGAFFATLVDSMVNRTQ